MSDQNSYLVDHATTIAPPGSETSRRQECAAPDIEHASARG